MSNEPSLTNAPVSDAAVTKIAVTSIEIACDTCAMEHSDHCQDCVVTFLCDERQAPTQAVVFDLAEQRAVRLLAAAGLVPTLKHREAI